MDLFRVAVVQAGSVPFNRERSTTKALDLTDQAIRSGARLIVFPEAFISGYPKGIDFGARVGMRSPEGRKWFRTYFESAITVPGPEVDELASAAREAGVHLVIGVIERDGGTLILHCAFLRPRWIAGQASQADAHRHGTAHLGLWRRHYPASFRYARRKNGGCHLLGKLHASAARGHVCKGYPDLLRPYGR